MILSVTAWPGGVVWAEAEEVPQPSAGEPRGVLEERVRVIGSAKRVKDVSGSAHFIDEQELSMHHHTDIHRVLSSVPGVYLQDEEGYGLRPNIGMRGSGVERSQKVTLMEDGVLVAPAPYAAPSAYYFPTAGRMSAVEISKGPSSIRQGPQTNGGVLNLISSEIPSKLGGSAELAVGEDDQVRTRLLAGGAGDRLGWVVEAYRHETDGFKRLDGGGSTGFDLEDYMAKLRFNSRAGARVYQSLELKLGSTDQVGQETYLGLTEDDFDRTPFRRYAASRDDSIRADHRQAQLRYFFVPSPMLDWTTTVYHNDFFRNWRKLESVNGIGISAVLADPAEFPDVALLLLRGEIDSGPDDELLVRNNRRDYDSRGVQSVLGLRLGSAKAEHDLEIGVRFHEDREDRFQENDTFDMTGGRMELREPGDPGSQSNRISDAEVFAFFVRDRIRLGNWTLTPGLRYENIDYTRRDFGTGDPQRTGGDLGITHNGVSEVIPGIGVDYRFNPQWSLFGGLHKGFSPPGPGEQADPEESLNHEIGVRFTEGSTSLQAVAFYNDYDNLIGFDTEAAGGTGSGDTFNGGEVEVSGLEVSFGRDLSSGSERGRSFPLRLAYTYTTGEFRSSFLTSFADWAPEVRTGDELTYLPAHQLSAGIGLRTSAWGVFLDASYVGEMRTHAGQGPIPADARIEEHVVLDASAEYRFRSNYRTFLQLRNLTDSVYVAARRPAGLRPGLPRSVLAGFGVEF